MNIKKLAPIVVLIAILITGCGKSNKEQKAPNAEPAKTAAQQPSAQQASTKQQQFPKLEAAKVTKAIAALDDFSALVKKFQNKPKPTTQEEMQNQQQEAMTEMGKMATKYGFQNGEELATYINGIIQFTLMEQTKKSMGEQLANMPDEQKNSEQMQSQIQKFNTQYETVKKTLGDDVIKIINKNSAKLDKFIKEQQAIQQAQQRQMQQTQPKATMKMKTPPPAAPKTNP